jgi:hypothetical protein
VPNPLRRSTRSVRIPVEGDRNQAEPVEFDLDELDLIGSGPDFIQALTNALQLNKRVPDVWRYRVDVSDGKVALLGLSRKLSRSRYADRPAADANGTRIILLLLESPHTDEYEISAAGVLKPIAPAQGNSLGGAGRGIEKYAPLVLNQLSLRDGQYSLVIANPVAYHCSLSLLGKSAKSSLKPSLRDHVWRQLFALESVQRRFIERLQAYQAFATVNCCTKELRHEVTDYLCKNRMCAEVFETEHPAIRWSTLNKKGIPVYRVACDGRTRTLITSQKN